jgi:hypothetical protein
MGLAYSLNEAHVGDHCERVGGQPGMRMMLPLRLMSSSKDKELRSIVPRPGSHKWVLIPPLRMSKMSLMQKALDA